MPYPQDCLKPLDRLFVDFANSYCQYLYRPGITSLGALLTLTASDIWEGHSSIEATCKTYVWPPFFFVLCLLRAYSGACTVSSSVAPHLQPSVEERSVGIGHERLRNTRFKGSKHDACLQSIQPSWRCYPTVLCSMMEFLTSPLTRKMPERAPRPRDVAAQASGHVMAYWSVVCAQNRGVACPKRIFRVWVDRNAGQHVNDACDKVEEHPRHWGNPNAPYSCSWRKTPLDFPFAICGEMLSDK